MSRQAVQISKSVLYSSVEDSMLDQLLDEIFNENLRQLSDINPLQYFYNNIMPNFSLRSKVEEIKKFISRPSAERKYDVVHLISGGGGSIFQYKDLIFKISPFNKMITSDKDITEISVPRYIVKLLKLNNYPGISSFISMPLYVRYGNFNIEFRAIKNIYYLSIMSLVYSRIKNRKIKITTEYLEKYITSMNQKDISTDKKALFYILATAHLVGSKILFLNNLHTFVSIRDTTSSYGYTIVYNTAVMSANKLSVKSLSEYFRDNAVDYNQLLRAFTKQLIFQILIFYYVMIGMKPGFAHRDFKLDNILVMALPSHIIAETLRIRDIRYNINIQTPLIFKLNDFDRSKIESASLWIEDFRYLTSSIKYYKNLPIELFILDIFNDITYAKLESLILDDMFSEYMTKDEHS